MFHFVDPCSGRTDTIIAAGAVSLQWFAEIELAAGERHVRQRGPNRIGEIRAGFHHDGDARRAGDVEPKLIVLHAKVAVAGLDQRIP